jgi:hypothetical protein
VERQDGWCQWLHEQILNPQALVSAAEESESVSCKERPANEPLGVGCAYSGYWLRSPAGSWCWICRQRRISQPSGPLGLLGLAGRSGCSSWLVGGTTCGRLIVFRAVLRFWAVGALATTSCLSVTRIRYSPTWVRPRPERYGTLAVVYVGRDCLSALSLGGTVSRVGARGADD